MPAGLTDLLGVNNGPGPYRPDLGQGNAQVGGVNPTVGGMSSFANVSTVASLYSSMAVPGIRPNDLGGPFDLRCMFPIANVSDIPAADSTFEEIRDDPRWNFSTSDQVFADLLEKGFAPYLKLASREWTSGLSTGFSYVGEDGVPVYVIASQDIQGFCKDWPYISPVIESIGDQLILTIVERYNNESMWSESLAKFDGGAVKGAPLEAETWASVTSATVGIELQNEYNQLQCLSTGTGDTTSLEGWVENCGGPPFAYGGKYWDGTPGAAHRTFVSQALAIKKRFPRVRVGGPAIGTGGTFGFPNTQGTPQAGGVAFDWIRDFLDAVSTATREIGIELLDWFSWHAYTNCISGLGTSGCNATGIDCSAENPQSMLSLAKQMRDLLDSKGFNSTRMVVSEHNAPFGSNVGNAFPGNVMGAAMTAANLIGLALSRDELNIAGAYIVNGIDGPFIPYNTESFPLGCTPEFTGTSSIPSEIQFTGGYVNRCQGTAMNINGANGMGLLYTNGDKKPTALVYELIAEAFLNRTVAAVGGLAQSVVGMQTDDEARRPMMVMLANADPFRVSPSVSLPSNCLDAGSVQVVQIKQRVRGSPPDIVLPNDICASGTVQVVGMREESSLGESGLLQADGSIELPPAGVALLSCGTSGAVGSVGLDTAVAIVFLTCLLL